MTSSSASFTCALGDLRAALQLATQLQTPGTLIVARFRWSTVEPFVRLDAQAPGSPFLRQELGGVATGEGQVHLQLLDLLPVVRRLAPAPFVTIATGDGQHVVLTAGSVDVRLLRLQGEDALPPDEPLWDLSDAEPPIMLSPQGAQRIDLMAGIAGSTTSADLHYVRIFNGWGCATDSNMMAHAVVGPSPDDGEPTRESDLGGGAYIPLHPTVRALLRRGATTCTTNPTFTRLLVDTASDLDPEPRTRTRLYLELPNDVHRPYPRIFELRTHARSALNPNGGSQCTMPRDALIRALERAAGFASGSHHEVHLSRSSTTPDGITVTATQPADERIEDTVHGCAFDAEPACTLRLNGKRLLKLLGFTAGPTVTLRWPRHPQDMVGIHLPDGGSAILMPLREW